MEAPAISLVILIITEHRREITRFFNIGRETSTAIIAHLELPPRPPRPPRRLSSLRPSSLNLKFKMALASDAAAGSVEPLAPFFLFLRSFSWKIGCTQDSGIS